MTGLTATINIITGEGTAAEIGAETTAAVETDREIGLHLGRLRTQNCEHSAKIGDEGVEAGIMSVAKGNTTAIGAEAGRGAKTEITGSAETDIGVDLPREGGAQAQGSLSGDLMVQKDHEDSRLGAPKTIVSSLLGI